MIHFALVIVAVCVIGWFALQLIGLVATGFSAGKGCGCLSLIIAGILALIVMAIAC